MKFIVKLFPEIMIKSQSVRLRFSKMLASSIRNILRQYNAGVAVVRHWDHIEVRAKDERRREEIREALTRIPGIQHILAVETSPYRDLQDIFAQTLAAYQHQLSGKTFCVRVKRRGKHSFTSQDVERYVGRGLHQHVDAVKVDLTNPQETVNLEINDDSLTLVKARYQGLSGFPIGTQEDVLSLISGGFDSGVSSYQLIRRGCRVHYCFFNLGGEVHEMGVRQTAYYLWHRFGSSHKVRFISIDFAPVVREILEKIDDGQMGVVLKRMMIRAASCVAERYGIQALVTGEALGQVSSQTLTNLRLIDEVTNTLILRPLITHDKQQIIEVARAIGTENLAKTMPEFCGVISKKPTAKAVKADIEIEEAKFDFTVLQSVVNQAEHLDIRQLVSQPEQRQTAVKTIATFVDGDVILDIRTRDEYEERPLKLQDINVLHLPFYRLSEHFSKLDQEKTYLLYCEHGVMSQLQALYLQEQGYNNVKVYRA